MSVVLEGALTDTKVSSYLSGATLPLELIPILDCSLPTADEAFIKKAIDGCNLNALRLALYQLTGDEELLELRVEQRLLRGGALVASVVDERDAPIVKQKALVYLLNTSARGLVPPPPTKARARELMDNYSGSPTSDVDFEFNYEELAFEEFPREPKWTQGPPPAAKREAHKVLIIGAGINGIAVGIQLKRLGIPFSILERYPSLGGTWFVNQYPECRVDTPSHLFQFKFEKNYPWTEYFAAAPETQRYLAHLAAKYGLEEHFLFEREALRADWHESSSTWRVQVKHRDGRTEILVANSVVSCAGSLSVAKMPDIPGIKDFKGSIFHTQEWDRSAVYHGKRVALIGTGSTGTQLAAPVARVAAHLTVYQRTPNWITAMENYRAVINEDVRWIFDNVPYYWNWHCYSVHVAALQLQGLQTIDPEWQARTGGINERNDKIREGLTAYIKSKTSQVPGLTEKVLPKYAPLVRRLVVDNGFYETLCRPNVDLVTGAIERITPTGIIPKAGPTQEFDVIILGCGFDVNAFFFPMEYIGRNGVHIHEAWKKDGPRSYLGITHLAQPNFFSTLGPNHAPRAGGLYSWAELWAKYVGLCIAGMIEKDIKSMEVKPEVYSAYQELLDAQLHDKIWTEPGHSYYVNSFGRANINCPFTMSEMQMKIREVNWEDYILN